jgi:4-hydroxy-2-oxoheptanedioate aldolase
MKINRVKSELRKGLPQIGTWLSLSNPTAARFMSRTGFHWLTLDMEHSSAHWETAASIFGVVADSNSIPLIRVPSISHENAKRALDQGAYGIVFPMCNRREQAEMAVSACHYPPRGTRSVGGNLHALNFGTEASEYYRCVSDEILVVVQAEHIDAVDRIDEILSVPGIDAVFVGPNDLLASMGKTPQMDSDDTEFVSAITKIREAAIRHGVAPGIHVADSASAVRRMEQGWQFIAISSELGFMLEGAAAAVQVAIGETGKRSARY